MFAYERDGKLKLQFTHSQIPSDADIELAKIDGTSHIYIQGREFGQSTDPKKDTTADDTQNDPQGAEV